MGREINQGVGPNVVLRKIKGHWWDFSHLCPLFNAVLPLGQLGGCLGHLGKGVVVVGCCSSAGHHLVFVGRGLEYPVMKIFISHRPKWRKNNFVTFSVTEYIYGA